MNRSDGSSPLSINGRRRQLVLIGRACLLASPLLLAAACSSSSGGSPIASDAAQVAPPVDAAGLDAPSALDASAAIDLAVGGDGGAGDKTYSIPVGDCFTFASATSQNMAGQSCGDLLLLSGANIDLSAGSGQAALCDLGGPFASLSAVPTSYASCMWTSYIEGGNGLAGEGLVVLDSMAVHHYRVRIVTNLQPTLVLSFSQID